MRNVTSHSVIIASGYGIAEYTHLAGEAFHRFPGIHWLSVPHQTTSLAFSVLCLVAVLHVTPLAARGIIAACNFVLFVHETVTSFWHDVFQRIEDGFIDRAKDMLWKLLDWLERRTKGGPKP